MHLMKKSLRPSVVVEVSSEKDGSSQQLTVFHRNIY